MTSYNAFGIGLDINRDGDRLVVADTYYITSMLMIGIIKFLKPMGKILLYYLIMLVQVM